jgi:hypothetical protein
LSYKNKNHRLAECYPSLKPPFLLFRKNSGEGHNVFEATEFEVAKAK